MSSASDSQETELLALLEGGAEQSTPPLFSAVKFEKFCATLQVDTKEKGRMPLLFLGGQRYLVEQIEAGLARGVHTFIVLKGRQMGISTVMLAFDIYWMLKHKGLQGAVVTDTDENREVFRANIATMIDTMRAKVRKQIKRHNRVQLMMKNASRAVYMVAGTKKNGALGRAKSANFLHGTETSSWGDEEGIGSLMNCLAQQNPNRLYVFESTARGFNGFYAMWETAKHSVTQAAVFIGWWRNELYCHAEDSEEYKHFWDGELTSDEALWVRDVYEQYGVEITAGQLSWWRWYVEDQMHGDVTLAMQEMPPTEEHAFQLSGSKYFSGESVNIAYKRSLDRDALYFRYKFGKEFEDTQFIETTRELAEVSIYATPVKAVQGFPEATYVMGADPAYGSSEWADRHAGCLYRCYADKIVQEVELASADWTDIQFAWVLAHICGWYGNTMLNLEMQGPGSAIFNELQHLKAKAASMPPGDPRAGAFDVIGRIRDYLWKKQDSMFGSFAYQWQSNHREKVRMMSTFRSNWERGIIDLNSPETVQEMRNIRREGDSIGGEGRAKDDRVLAAAIGHIAWNDWLMIELQGKGETYARAHEPKKQMQMYTPIERSVIGYLQQQKIKFPGLT
jgi:hypothetical protein